jgi:hypothetical protein
MDTHFLLFKGGENAADPGRTTALRAFAILGR